MSWDGSLTYSWQENILTLEQYKNLSFFCSISCFVLLLRSLFVSAITDVHHIRWFQLPDIQHVQSQHCLCLPCYRISTTEKNSDLEENCSPNMNVKRCRRTAHWSCVNKTNKRRPQGVLTRTGPQTVMPKSYKLLCCLNKTHINLSSVIFLWRSPTLKCFHLTFI